MNERMPLLILPCLLALPATPVAQVPAPQVPPAVRQGMMSASPVGLLVGDQPGALLIADPGQSGAAPTPWSAARFGSSGQGYPEYTLDAMFGQAAGDVVLSAISTGNDWMPAVNADGTLDMTDHWFGLSVSVTNASLGAPGSHVQRVVSAGDSPGAEIFTYYAEGSVGIVEVSLVHTTVSERSRESLGLAAQPPPPVEARADVTGLDYGLGVISFDPEGRAGPMFGQRGVFYFSLHPDCIDQLPPDFATSGGVSVPAEAGTVYRMLWLDPGTGDAWSQPEVYRSKKKLFPGEEEREENLIDALAVDHDTNTVVFSTQPRPGWSQILVHDDTWTGPPLELLTETGTPFVTHLGLGGSDVDGTCGVDPEASFAVGGVLGIPKACHAAPGEEPLGISLVRAQPGASGASSLHVHVTGAGDLAVPAIFALYATDAETGEAASPLETGAWLLLASTPVGPGATETSWTFPAPSVALDLAVAAVLWDAAGTTAQRESWVSMLRLDP
jgi:hypothetical protein